MASCMPLPATKKNSMLGMLRVMHGFVFQRLLSRPSASYAQLRVCLACKSDFLVGSFQGVQRGLT